MDTGFVFWSGFYHTQLRRQQLHCLQPIAQNNTTTPETASTVVLVLVFGYSFETSGIDVAAYLYSKQFR